MHVQNKSEFDRSNMYLRSLIILLLIGVLKSANHECTFVGRFPLYQSNCSSYLWCTVTSSGKLVTTVASCPRLSRFNPMTQKCVRSTTYICPEFICEGVTNSSIRYKDLNDVRNKTYIECVYDVAYGAFVPRLGVCPSGQIFVIVNVTDNNRGNCSSNP